MKANIAEKEFSQFSGSILLLRKTTLTKKSSEELHQYIGNCYWLREICFDSVTLETDAFEILLNSLIQHKHVVTVTIINTNFDKKNAITHKAIIELLANRRREYEKFVNACENGLIAIVKDYLKEGYHPDGLQYKVEHSNQTPLSSALVNKKNKIAKLIILKLLEYAHKYHVNNLDFSCGRLSADSFAMALQLLDQVSQDEGSISLRGFDLSYLSFPLIISQSFKGLGLIKNIETLKLDHVMNNSIINHLIIKEIARCIMLMENLKFVSLNNNFIGNVEFKKLIEGIKGHGNLVKLSLCHNYITAIDGRETNELIQQHREAREFSLDLSGNFILDDQEKDFFISSSLSEQSIPSMILPDRRITRQTWLVYLLALRKCAYLSEHAMLGYEGILDSGQRMFKVAHLTVTKNFCSYGSVKIDFFEHHDLCKAGEYFRGNYFIAPFIVDRSACLELHQAIISEINEIKDGKKEDISLKYRPVVFSEADGATNCLKWAIEKIKAYLKIELPIASLGVPSEAVKLLLEQMPHVKSLTEKDSSNTGPTSSSCRFM